MTLSEQITQATQSDFTLTDQTPPRFAAFRYPKWPPMMRFDARRYEAAFGSLFTMDTVAMGGLMRLSTIVFTPCAGQRLPVLLIDSMSMAKKALTYVEYYDCTASGADLPLLAGQPEEFAALPDYAEKPAWYVPRRMAGSLIKGGKGAAPAALCEMALTCVSRYLRAASRCEASPANLPKLRAFRQEMVERGNPSSATLHRALGEQTARDFFETMIMPIDTRGESL